MNQLISEELKNVIASSCNETFDKGEYMLYRGFVGDHSLVKIPSSFEYVGEWSNVYRQVYTSDSNLSTIVFCEGDMMITVHQNGKSYNDEMLSNEEFYKQY